MGLFCYYYYMFAEEKLLFHLVHRYPAQQTRVSTLPKPTCEVSWDTNYPDLSFYDFPQLIQVNSMAQDQITP